MNNERASGLLFRAQAEQNGSRVYEAGIRCAVNDALEDALKETRAGCLSRTRAHPGVSTGLPPPEGRAKAGHTDSAARVKAARRESL